MMWRRLLLALGVALAVLVAPGAIWWFLPPRPGVTAANCARIKKGMRLEEVEAILGGPPGVYRDGQRLEPYPGLYLSEDGETEWMSEAGIAVVWFRGDGTVRRAHFGRTSTASPLQRATDYLRSFLP